MEYKKIGNIIAVKISRGDEVLSSLKEVVTKENIKFAKIEGIGAISDVELGVLVGTEYITKVFKGDYELLSIKGSIAGDKQIHMHASISGEDFKAHGGHFFKGTVCGVVELFITLIGDKEINKKQKEEDLFPTWDLNKK